MTEAENALRTPLPEEERREIPALLRSAYWPQALWPLHDLFERFEEVTPFPGEEDTVYIRVPLGDAYGGRRGLPPARSLAGDAAARHGGLRVEGRILAILAICGP